MSDQKSTASAAVEPTSVKQDAPAVAAAAQPAAQSQPQPPAPPQFSLALNPDQEELLAWVKGFCDEYIRPNGAKYDKLQETPWEIINEAAKVGLYSLDFYMSAFSDPTGLTLLLCLEELARADAGIALALFGSCLGVAGIIANGTPEQVAHWLPRCFGSEKKPALAAFCSSEADAGSDVSKVSTRAVYDEKNDEWVLNGTKAWITNGGIADVHVVVASVDSSLGSHGHASFVVPAGTAGLSQGQKYHKMGIRASHTAEVVLADVRVPGSCLLGGKEKLDKRLARARSGQSGGNNAAMATFEVSRPAVGAMALGVAVAAYEYALNYALTRETFGKSIAEHQIIAAKFADMRTRIDAARLLVWRAGWMAISGKPFAHAEGSQAKLFASELAVEVTREAIQILGGAGYVEDHPVEQWHRDALIFTIFEGTSQIQQLIIASAEVGKRIR